MTKIYSPTFEEMELYTVEDFKRFYSIFTETIWQIVIKHKGRILTARIDNVACYFPKTKEPPKVNAIKDFLDCCVEVITRRQSLSDEMTSKHPSQVSYSVRADYGTIRWPEEGDIADPNTRFWAGLPPLYKMGLKTPANTVVIGDHLYQVIREFTQLESQFNFETIGEFANDSGTNSTLYRLKF